jgi:hypothetical protein
VDGDFKKNSNFGCYRIVEYDIAAVWCCVGNAAIGEKDVGKLAGAKGQPVVGVDLENGSVVLDVVSME